MPIIADFALPKSAQALELPKAYGASFFLAFIASKDPATGESWCPDVRAALPALKAAFAAPGAPDMAFVEVGQRPEWRVPTNAYRTVWNVHNVPALVRYAVVDGVVEETGRLVEGEILQEKRLRELLSGKK